MIRTCRFLLSFARFCENISFLAQRCYKYERWGLGGAQPPPSAKHRMGGQSVTRKALLLAKSCKDLLAQKLPKKNERGGWGGRSPPHLQNM